MMRNSALLLFLIAQMSTSFNYYVAKRMVTKRMESIQLSMSTNARGYNSNNNYYNNNNNNNNNNNMNSDAQAEGGERGISAPRSTVPSRKDTCRIFISGVVGTEPKEQFLKNGHYVLNFALAVVGHFNPVHDWERYKPSETMWVQTELWDDEAKEALGNIRKGSPFSGFGALILNKWTDKATGEEKKMFKVRILKQMPTDQIDEMIGEFKDDVDAMYPPIEPPSGAGMGGESSFGRSAPNSDSQLFQSPPPARNNDGANISAVRSKAAASGSKKVDSDDDDMWSKSRDPRVPF